MSTCCPWQVNDPVFRVGLSCPLWKRMVSRKGGLVLLISSLHYRPGPSLQTLGPGAGGGARRAFLACSVITSLLASVYIMLMLTLGSIMPCFIIRRFIRHSRIRAGIWELEKGNTNPQPHSSSIFPYLFPAAVAVRKLPLRLCVINWDGWLSARSRYF